MNANEGIRRIAVAVRWIADGIATLVALLGFTGIYNGLVKGATSLFVGVAVLMVAVLIFVFGRLISWVIAGFAKSKAVTQEP